MTVPYPQSYQYPANYLVEKQYVVTGIDADGNLIYEPVNFTAMEFEPFLKPSPRFSPAIFGIKATLEVYGETVFNDEGDLVSPYATTECGLKRFVVGSGVVGRRSPFRPGMIVQLLPEYSDGVSYAVGTIINEFKSDYTDPGNVKGNTVLDIAVFARSYDVETAHNWTMQVIGWNGGSGVVEAETFAASSTEHRAEAGRKTFDIIGGPYFPEKSSVLVSCSVRAEYITGPFPDWPQYYPTSKFRKAMMVGDVVSLVDGKLTVDIANVAGEPGPYSDWTIRLLGGPIIPQSAPSGNEDWGSITEPVSPGTETDDYRFVYEAVTLAADYRFVTEAVTSSEDYGSI